MCLGGYVHHRPLVMVRCACPVKASRVRFIDDMVRKQQVRQPDAKDLLQPSLCRSEVFLVTAVSS